MDRTAFQEACLALRLSLSATQLNAFEAFEEALYEANAVMNLTRVAPEDCWLRHYIDSLLLAEFIRPGSSVLDIGTGPGFPAWPLACARPDLSVTAMDSNGKMLGFLRNQRLPNLTIVQARAEDKPDREKFDVVTGRALAPLPAQLEISAAPCRKGGLVVPMRTTNDSGFEEAPLRGLGLKLEDIQTRPLPGTDVVRVFPLYRKVTPTSPKFPRAWAEIKRDPR